MMRGGRGKDVEKVMGPLFPRLHVNDAAKGRGPRAPPRNKMALYEQFSVPSQRFSSAAAGAHNGGGGGSLAPSTSASQVGRNHRPLFQPFFVSSNEPVCSSEKTNTNSIAAQADNTTRIESGKQSPHLMSKDIYATGSIAECDLQQREDDNINNSSRKKTTNDEFMVPSIFCSGIPLQSTEDHVRVQEKPIPFCSPSPHMNGPALSKSSAKCAITDKKNLEGIDVSDVRARKFPQIKEKEPAQILSNVEVKEKSSSTQASKEKLGKKNPKASLTRDRVTGINVSDKPYSGNDGYQARSRNEDVETHNHPTMRISAYSRPHAEIENINRTTLLERNLRENGEKRKRSAGHHDMEQTHDLSVSSLESIPGLEISPDDVLDTIGAKHFWKARRAIVNQQRVFAVQVFELHRLTKVQKLIAASPHLLIEGDPCLGITLAASKNKLDDGNVKVQSPSAENKDDTQPTLPQSEYSKENPEQDQPSPSHNDGHCGTHHDQAATNGAFTNNLLAIPAPLDNKQSKWCHPPQNQWLVPVMSPSEGLVYKPCAGPCPPAGSFLAPFYANCTPLSLPSTAGDFMNSAYSVPIHLQPQHMAVPGAYPMHLNYFPPFSLPVMNPVASASVVEQVSHLAVSHPNEHMEQHSRSSCNMSPLRSEAFSGGIWRFHASRDSELQGSSVSSPFERPQGEGRSTVPLFPAASVGNAQPQHSSGSWENQTCVIRVVPHNARTASESAARIFRSIQMERRHNDS